MNYILTIASHHYEISPTFEKLIRSFFNERVSDYVLVHNNTESYLSVFLKEKLTEEVRRELMHYFNIEVKTYTIAPTITSFDFQSPSQSTDLQKEEILGFYQTKEGINYPYIQTGRTIYFSNPVHEKPPTLEQCHKVAVDGFYLYHSSFNKKVYHTDCFADFYFDKVKTIEQPVQFLYNLFNIQSVPFLNLNEFKYTQNSSHSFGMYCDTKECRVIFEVKEIINGKPYGNISILFYNIQPSKSKAYSKKMRETFNLFIHELSREEQISYLRYYSGFDIKRDMLCLDFINLHNPAYHAVLGGILQCYGEKFIPPCFDIPTIKEQYEHFQTFDTLYRFKIG